MFKKTLNVGTLIAYAIRIGKGNTERLLELVHEDVVLYADGGGKVKAAQILVKGLSNVLQLHRYLIKVYAAQFSYPFVTVNGLPGIVFTMDNGDRYVYSFAFKGNKIETIYSVANPDKLSHVSI